MGWILCRGNFGMFSEVGKVSQCAPTKPSSTYMDVRSPLGARITAAQGLSKLNEVLVKVISVY